MASTVDVKVRRVPAAWVLKVTMAVTGLLWAAFVLIHLYGNTKVFFGAESFNGYAHWLRHALYPLFPEGAVLWAFRIVLVISLVLHVAAAAILWSRGRASGGRASRTALTARFRGGRGSLQAFSARLMPFTGVMILAFVIIHVLDLTTGTRPIATAEFGGHETAYENLVASFSRPWMADFYVLMMLLIALHVFHGIRTAAQDLGAMGYRLRLVAVWVAGLASLAIVLGNALIPLAVQMGILT